MGRSRDLNLIVYCLGIKESLDFTWRPTPCGHLSGVRLCNQLAASCHEVTADDSLRAGDYPEAPSAKNRAQRVARPIVFIVNESRAAGEAARGHSPGGLPSAFWWSRFLRRLCPLYHPCTTPRQHNSDHMGSPGMRERRRCLSARPGPQSLQHH